MTRHSALGWVLHSPLRLAAVLAVTVAVVLAWLWLGGPQESGSSVETVVTVTASQRHPAGAHGARSSAGEAAASPAESRHLLRVFLRGYVLSPRERARPLGDAVRRHATPALWAGLRLTDPAELPRGVVRHIERITTGTFLVEYVVELGAGTDLAVTLVADEHDWKVSSVEPAEGR